MILFIICTLLCTSVNTIDVNTTKENNNATIPTNSLTTSSPNAITTKNIKTTIASNLNITTTCNNIDGTCFLNETTITAIEITTPIPKQVTNNTTLKTPSISKKFRSSKRETCSCNLKVIFTQYINYYLTTCYL